MKAKNRTYDFSSGLKKVVPISDSIVLLEYATRTQLCEALVRISEFSESPEFGGKVFTLGQYRQWYSQQYGSWTYNEDWSGFNVGASAFKPFFDGLFDPLTGSEQELVTMLKPRPGNYYVIGTFTGSDADVYEHEICHAMFATNAAYRVDVTSLILKNEPQLVTLREFIRNLGYGEAVLLDECHAYMSESHVYLKEKQVDYPLNLTDELRVLKLKYRDF